LSVTEQTEATPECKCTTTLYQKHKSDSNERKRTAALRRHKLYRFHRHILAEQDQHASYSALYSLRSWRHRDWQVIDWQTLPQHWHRTVHQHIGVPLKTALFTHTSNIHNH